MLQIFQLYLQKCRTASKNRRAVQPDLEVNLPYDVNGIVHL